MRVLNGTEPAARETVLGFSDKEIQLIEQALNDFTAPGVYELWDNFDDVVNSLGLTKLRS
jgi:hypothetical protein